MWPLLYGVRAFCVCPLYGHGDGLTRRTAAARTTVRRASYVKLKRAPASSRSASGVGMPASDELTVDGVAKLTVPLLKAALSTRGLPTTGLKADLAARLVEALQQAPPAAGAAADAEPVAEAPCAETAEPAAPAAPALPAKPSVQPVTAPEPVPVTAPAPAPAPPAQSPVRQCAAAPSRMRNPKGSCVADAQAQGCARAGRR